jgi:hypothetical protein
MPTSSKIAVIGACGLWTVTRTALARVNIQPLDEYPVRQQPLSDTLHQAA